MCYIAVHIVNANILLMNEYVAYMYLFRNEFLITVNKFLLIYFVFFVCESFEFMGFVKGNFTMLRKVMFVMT